MNHASMKHLLNLVKNGWLESAQELIEAALAKPEQKPVAYWNGKDMFKRADEVQYVVNWTDYYHYPLYSEPVKERISEPLANQEPVAWVERDGELIWHDINAAIKKNLYTAPPSKPWVGLTFEEIKDI